MHNFLFLQRRLEYTLLLATKVSKTTYLHMITDFCLVVVASHTSGVIIYCVMHNYAGIIFAAFITFDYAQKYRRSHYECTKLPINYLYCLLHNVA